MKRTDVMGIQSLEIDPNLMARQLVPEDNPFASVIGPGAALPVADFRDGVMSFTTTNVTPSGAPRNAKWSFLSDVAKAHALKPQNEAQEAAKQQIIDDLSPALIAAERLTAEIEAERAAAVEKKLWELRAECKRHESVVVKLKNEADAAEMELQNAIAEKDSIYAELRDLSVREQRGQHIPRWATRDELADWEALVEGVRARARENGERMLAATQAVTWAGMELEPAIKKMRQLECAHVRLTNEHNRVSGYYDPEFGLYTTPAHGVTAD
jgi:hypothetical protein